MCDVIGEKVVGDPNEHREFVVSGPIFRLFHRNFDHSLIRVKNFQVILGLLWANLGLHVIVTLAEIVLVGGSSVCEEIRSFCHEFNIFVACGALGQSFFFWLVHYLSMTFSIWNIQGIFHTPYQKISLQGIQSESRGLLIHRISMLANYLPRLFKLCGPNFFKKKEKKRLDTTSITSKWCQYF